MDLVIYKHGKGVELRLPVPKNLEDAAIVGRLCAEAAITADRMGCPHYSEHHRLAKCFCGYVSEQFKGEGEE